MAADHLSPKLRAELAEAYSAALDVSADEFGRSHKHWLESEERYRLEATLLDYLVILRQSGLIHIIYRDKK